jgi:hypothetical protein
MWVVEMPEHVISNSQLSAWYAVTAFEGNCLASPIESNVFVIA